MQSFRNLYDPALFEMTASRLMGLMGGYLRESQEAPFSALPWRDPQALKQRALELMDRPPLSTASATHSDAVSSRTADLAKEIFGTFNRLHSPHYMGHQVPPPLPISGLFESLGTIANQASGVYEMGQFSNAAERALVQKLGKYLGWEGCDFDAIATHGGSAANLTALLAARNIRYRESWRKGIASVSNGRLPSIICSADSHYSVARAAAIIGLGADQVIKAPTGPGRRMDSSLLDGLIEKSARDGKDVFCIVASSCSTATGSFDAIQPLAEVCRRHGIWLHVDAAHGGGLLLSTQHRHLLDGIEHADSVTWDAHKMMFVPALCTFLFYRDKRHSFEAFDQDAPYLFAKEGNPTLEFDSAVRTLECTKRPIALALWSVWCLYGPKVFESLVDRTVALAREFYEMLSAAQDFEPLHEPDCNILCFRYLPDRSAPIERVSEQQAMIRRKIIESGQFYITATRLDGLMALRVTLINPLTERRHLAALMDTIRGTA